MDLYNNVTERIEHQFTQLSKGQQKVARFVLDNLTYVGVHAASDVGKRAGTSETTVIRFCYAIGLDGFAQLQKEVTMHVFASGSTLSNYVASKEALFQEEHMAQKVMGQISQQIVSVASHVDSQQFKSFTQKLHEAETIYLIGSGASHFAVQWLQFTLNILRPRVQLVDTEPSALIRTLQQMNERAVVIVVSLHRYSKETIALAEAFQKQGAHVMAITDSSVAPIHSHANTTFVLQQAELSTIDLMPTLIAFMNTVVAGMIAQDTTYYKEQRKAFDDFQNNFLADKWS